MVKEKIKILKQKIQPKQAKPIFCNPDVISSLETLHKGCIVVTICKSANNFAFISKNITYKPLAEIGLSNSKSKTYSKN